MTARIDRVSDADLAFLAMGRGQVPEQLAVVLVLDRQLDAAECVRLLRERAGGVPRLRQRLVRTPVGCGGPIWADDEAFDPGRHFSVVRCPAPGDDRALAGAVLPVVLWSLPRDRPLWRAVLVDGLAGGRSAVVLVTHHVLSDGWGGLAILDRLLDGAVAALLHGGLGNGPAMAFLISGSGTSIGAITGALLIARRRVVGLVVALLFAGVVILGWTAALALP